MALPFHRLSRRLQEAIEAGGIFRAARILREGHPLAVVRRRLGAEFPSLAPPSLSALIRRGAEALLAGRAATAAPGQTRVGSLGMPQHPTMFGDDPGGRRVRLVVEITHPDLPRGHTVRLDLSGEETLNEVFQLARSQMAERVKASPQAFGLDQGTAEAVGENLAVAAGVVTIISGVTRY